MKNSHILDMEFVLSFLKFLFNEKDLAPTTVSSYKSALGKLLEMAFDSDMSSKIFSWCLILTHLVRFLQTLLRLYSLLRHSCPLPAFSMSLEKVRQLSTSEMLSVNSNLLNLSMKCMHLAAMATSSKVSELWALPRGEKFTFFTHDSVTLFPNPNFFSKYSNQKPTSRRESIVVRRLSGSQEHPHLVFSENVGLERTSSPKSFHLFVILLT